MGWYGGGRKIGKWSVICMLGMVMFLVLGGSDDVWGDDAFPVTIQYDGKTLDWSDQDSGGPVLLADSVYVPIRSFLTSFAVDDELSWERETDSVLLSKPKEVNPYSAFTAASVRFVLDNYTDTGGHERIEESDWEVTYPAIRRGSRFFARLADLTKLYPMYASWYGPQRLVVLDRPGQNWESLGLTTLHRFPDMKLVNGEESTDIVIHGLWFYDIDSPIAALPLQLMDLEVPGGAQKIMRLWFTVNNRSDAPAAFTYVGSNRLQLLVNDNTAQILQPLNPSYVGFNHPEHLLWSMTGRASMSGWLTFATGEAKISKITLSFGGTSTILAQKIGEDVD